MLQRHGSLVSRAHVSTSYTCYNHEALFSRDTEYEVNRSFSKDPYFHQPYTDWIKGEMAKFIIIIVRSIIFICIIDILVSVIINDTNSVYERLTQ